MNIKFTVTIQELLHKYQNKKETDHDFICLFIRYNLIPQRSIFHKLYMLFHHQPTKSVHFMKQLAETLNCQPQITLPATLNQHPDFNHINTNQSPYQYRLQVLQQLAKLHPNLTFTFEY